MIERKLYIEKIKPFINKKLIKVLTGQRRVGKSCVLQLLFIEIKKRYPDANFIFIDKEKYEFDSIRTHTDLMEYVQKKINPDKMNYLFIDEIQDISDFERVLRSLHNENNFDIYCTGSNANIFASELTTYLSGRYISFHIGSLDFNEYCIFHKSEANNETLFDYLKYGGLPYLIHLPKDDKICFDYLNNIVSTILFRDVVNRHKIRDTRFLMDLLRFIADNTGSLFSANKISRYLKNQRINKNVALIIDYLSYIESAFFINRIERTDVIGKKLFEIGEKYYFEDIGLRNTLVGFNPADIGKLIENVVFLHLRNCNYEVKVGSINKREIDFAAQKGGETIYVQVAYLLSDAKVTEREFGNLLQIPDNFPKYVVSFDQYTTPNTYKGIEHFSLLKFLQQQI